MFRPVNIASPPAAPAPGPAQQVAQPAAAQPAERRLAEKSAVYAAHRNAGKRLVEAYRRLAAGVANKGEAPHRHALPYTRFVPGIRLRSGQYGHVIPLDRRTGQDAGPPWTVRGRADEIAALQGLADDYARQSALKAQQDRRDLLALGPFAKLPREIIDQILEHVPNTPDSRIASLALALHGLSDVAKPTTRLKVRAMRLCRQAAQLRSMEEFRQAAGAIDDAEMPLEGAYRTQVIAALARRLSSMPEQAQRQEAFDRLLHAAERSHNVEEQVRQTGILASTLHLFACRPADGENLPQYEQRIRPLLARFHRLCDVAQQLPSAARIRAAGHLAHCAMRLPPHPASLPCIARVASCCIGAADDALAAGAVDLLMGAIFDVTEHNGALYGPYLPHYQACTGRVLALAGDIGAAAPRAQAIRAIAERLPARAVLQHDGFRRAAARHVLERLPQLIGAGGSDAGKADGIAAVMERIRELQAYAGADDETRHAAAASALAIVDRLHDTFAALADEGPRLLAGAALARHLHSIRPLVQDDLAVVRRLARVLAALGEPGGDAGRAAAVHAISTGLLNAAWDRQDMDDDMRAALAGIAARIAGMCGGFAEQAEAGNAVLGVARQFRHAAAGIKDIVFHHLEMAAAGLADPERAQVQGRLAVLQGGQF